MGNEAIRAAYDVRRLAGSMATAVGTSAALTGPRGGPRALHRTVEHICDALDGHPPGKAWTPDMAATARGVLRLTVGSGAGEQAVDASHAALKAVRLAHEVLSGDGAAAPPHEVRGVVRSWERRGPVARDVVDALVAMADAPPPHAPAAAAGEAIGAAFTWWARRKGSTARERRLGRVPVMPGPLGPDARPAIRLVPDGGEPFEVLACGGSLFRPVFSPGSWEPLAADRFADAASGCAAWLDAPHCEPLIGGGVVLAPSDACAPDTVETSGQEAARREAARAALTRAGRLATHRGILHREVAAPSLAVHVEVGWDFSTRSPTCGVGLGWSFPDGLRSGTDMSTACRDPVARRQPLSGVALAPGLQARTLSALARWIAEGRAEGGSRFVLTLDEALPVDVLDAELFPAEVADLLAAAGAMPAGTLSGGGWDAAHTGLPPGGSLAGHLAREAGRMAEEADEAFASFVP